MGSEQSSLFLKVGMTTSCVSTDGNGPVDSKQLLMLEGEE